MGGRQGTFYCPRCLNHKEECMFFLLLSVLSLITRDEYRSAVHLLVSQSQQGPAAQPVDAESDLIYRGVVDWRVAHPGEGPKAKQLVFLDTTVPYSCLGSEEKDCSSEVKKQ